MNSKSKLLASVGVGFLTFAGAALLTAHFRNKKRKLMNEDDGKTREDTNFIKEKEEDTSLHRPSIPLKINRYKQAIPSEALRVLPTMNQFSEEEMNEEVWKEFRHTKEPEQLSSGVPDATSEVVNYLNRANGIELQQIEGVGPVLATRLISNRPYSRVEDIQLIDRMPASVYQKIRTATNVADISN